MHLCKVAQGHAARRTSSVLLFLGIFFLTVSLCFGAETSGAIKDFKKKRKISKPIIIESDTLTADNTKKFIVFKGNVVVREEFTLCSDVLRVTYDDNQEISDITATGSVRVFQGDRVATAGRVQYKRLEGTMILTESPVIRQCSDEVSGEKITFNVKDETVFIEASHGGRVRAIIMPEKKCDMAGEAKIEKKDICK